METLSTADLLERLGLKSPDTLRRWRMAGLIDQPTIERHPDGKGRIARWPIQVLAQAMDIREKLKSGQSLEDLSAKRKKPATRRYSFKDDWEQRERQMALFRLRDFVTRSLRRFSRQNLGAVGSELIEIDHLATAEGIALRGVRPLLAISNDGVSVVATDKLGEWLLERRLEIFAILPIELPLPSD